MKIEIWSDLVCPWCYIGKRRLESALEEFGEEAEVKVEWRSFELDPSAPTEPDESLADALATKYGMSPDQARGMMAHMARTGAQEGLKMNFDRPRGGNTMDAHRLLHLAAEKGLQAPMKERLFRAYMTEGRSVSNRGELAALAAEVGLDPDEVRITLESDEFTVDVRRDQERARELGVSGVPFFLLNERLAVSGAQPPKVLLEALRSLP
jgi:predicted DsbA family dithiol-disulfide isomerase